METLLDWWAAYESTVAIAAVDAFFALSTYAVMSTGLLSFATVAFAACGGFLGVQLMPALHWSLVLVLPASAVASVLVGLCSFASRATGWHSRA